MAPDVPKSARASERTEASTTITDIALLGKIRHCGPETDASAVATLSRLSLEAGKEFLGRRDRREPCQFGNEELLQGLAGGLGPPNQDGVHLGGKVSDQHVRHAFIVLAETRSRKARAGAVQVHHRCSRRYGRGVATLWRHQPLSSRS